MYARYGWHVSRTDGSWCGPKCLCVSSAHGVTLLPIVEALVGTASTPWLTCYVRNSNSELIACRVDAFSTLSSWCHRHHEVAAYAGDSYFSKSVGVSHHLHHQLIHNLQICRKGTRLAGRSPRSARPAPSAAGAARSPRRPAAASRPSPPTSPSSASPSRARRSRRTLAPAAQRAAAERQMWSL